METQTLCVFVHIIPPKHQFIKTSSKKIWIYLKQYYIDVGKSIGE